MRVRTVVAGLVAALAGVTAGLALPLFGLPGYPVMFASWVGEETPGPIFAFLLDRLLYFGKPVLLAGVTGLLVVIMTLLALPLGRVAARRPLRWLDGPSYGLLIGALEAASVPLLGLHLTAPAFPTAAAILAPALLYGFVLGWALNALVAPHELPGAEAARASAEMTRREMLVSTAGMVAALALVTSLGLNVRSILAAVKTPRRPDIAGDEAAPVGANGLPEGVTAVADHYIVSKNFKDPEVDAAGWSLAVEGMVDRPFSLTLAELDELATVERYFTLECISNEVGGDLMSTAHWQGVPLRDLLTRAGVHDGVRYVMFTSVDDYTERIPLAKAMDPETLVATRMNGDPLQTKHGFPARVIQPGYYGMKNPKWLKKIEAGGNDREGYWEQQGWVDEAVVKTMSRIDQPVERAKLSLGDGPVQLSGVAYAGDRGIQRVEVSADDGKTWEPMTLRKPLSPVTWVLWTGSWSPPGPGSYKLTVRAVDGRGDVQTNGEVDTYPSGATGFHVIGVTVTG
jgi:DMSO/TMAO reductase YedYZ molybdopterin-dependent catalytic subunit